MFNFSKHKLFLKEYYQHINYRKNLNLPPLPLNPEQVSELVRCLEFASKNKREMIKILNTCVVPGVNHASKIKADYLFKIINNQTNCEAEIFQINHAEKPGE